MWKTAWKFLNKSKSRSNIWSYLLYFQRELNPPTKRSLHSSALCGTSHDCQEWNQQTLMSTENVAVIPNGVLVRHKERWNPVICEKLNGNGGH